MSNIEAIPNSLWMGYLVYFLFASSDPIILMEDDPVLKV